LFCRRHGIHLPQPSVRASVLETTEVPELGGTNVATPGFCFRRSESGGYVVAMSGTGTFPITLDAFRYVRDFWPSFRQRRNKLKLRVGRDFFSGLGSSANWAFDQATPFEVVRVLDPAPDEELLARGLEHFKAAFPAALPARMARAWGGMIDSTPDLVPVIDKVDALPGFSWRPAFPATASASALRLAGSPRIRSREARRSWIPHRSAIAA
jgi:glycine/D-amino acid oxidase-like deaminating enzyme